MGGGGGAAARFAAPSARLAERAAIISSADMPLPRNCAIDGSRPEPRRNTYDCTRPNTDGQKKKKEKEKEKGVTNLGIGWMEGNCAFRTLFEPTIVHSTHTPHTAHTHHTQHTHTPHESTHQRDPCQPGLPDLQTHPLAVRFKHLHTTSSALLMEKKMEKKEREKGGKGRGKEG